MKEIKRGGWFAGQWPNVGSLLELLAPAKYL